MPWDAQTSPRLHCNTECLRLTRQLLVRLSRRIGRRTTDRPARWRSLLRPISPQMTVLLSLPERANRCAESSLLNRLLPLLGARALMPLICSPRQTLALQIRSVILASSLIVEDRDEMIISQIVI